jgi:hypothetical protein
MDIKVVVEVDSYDSLRSLVALHYSSKRRIRKNPLTAPQQSWLYGRRVWVRSL